ncbi:MAG: response regulator [Calditrichaeota bacterium]|nr:response regulator [Calditrichota bacterium]
MQKNILVVDDEAAIRSLLERAFMKSDYELHAVESAEAALELIRKENYQVFFLDLLLPKMNGLDLCVQIKKVRPTAFVFAMTGYASVFDLVKCREVGFDDYFPKPFEIEDLKTATDEAFGKIDRWRKNGG